MNQQLEYLIEVCGYGLLDRAKMIVEAGVDINDNHNGFTPLVAAIYGSNVDLVIFLLKSGAKVNLGNPIALHEAIENLLVNMVEEQTQQPDEEDLKIIETLIQYGADLTLVNEKGYTALQALNTYAVDEATFELFKNIFRPFIPNIDEYISYKAKERNNNKK